MRNFTDFLREIGRGRLNEHLTSALAEVVEAVETTEKKGGLTLKIEVEPKGDHVVLSPKVETKVPRETLAPAIYFVDNETYELTRRDPRQMDIQDHLHSIDGEKSN